MLQLCLDGLGLRAEKRHLSIFACVMLQYGSRTWTEAPYRTSVPRPGASHSIPINAVLVGDDRTFGSLLEIDFSTGILAVVPVKQ